MSASSSSLEPFRVKIETGSPVRRSVLRFSRPIVEWMLKFRAMNAIYAQIAGWTDSGDDRHFSDKALSALGIEVDVSDADLANIPKEGPVVVVANHPFGGLEGLILDALLRRARPDVKLLANYVLALVPELRDSFFFVDPFDRADSAKRNLASMRGAIDWLRNDHVLGVFPAGGVSHLHVKHRTVSDPPWNQNIARIVRRTKAPVVPIYFDGRNSNLFQLMGLVHPMLRTVMLPRELLKKRDRTVQLRIGSPIAPGRLARFDEFEEITAYLRTRTYLLRSTLPAPPGKSRWWQREDTEEREMEPLAEPADPALLQAEIDALPSDQRLLQSREFDVILGRAEQMPHIIQELGRLREESFRPVGEGTGRAIDLDRFDKYYLHLFVWHPAKQRIVGAYRLGATDEILSRYGKGGLYTSTLFHFKTKLLDQISPALELGRSFVHPDYQRSYAPLMLLWKGIGAYIAQNPRYCRLFGPVSISASYSSLSRHLLLRFLRVHRYLPDLAKLAKPKKPPRMAPPRGWRAKEFSTIVQDLDEVNAMVSELETDGKPMPVLLRQYLKLNGQLLGFNVDPDFGDVVDGLILCDVRSVDRQILFRYMGKESSKTFLAHHGIATE